MTLPEKLRRLRTERGLTQEAVAAALGISGQTVSKWERGLLSPDISLLPRIAVLYETSLDALFDMNALRADASYDSFGERIRALRAKGDNEGIYHAFITEIELVPGYFEIYPDLFLHVLRSKMFDEPRLRRLIRVAAYAERHCPDEDIRHAIYHAMAQICLHSSHFFTRDKAREYYQKLPQLRYAREILAAEVLEGAERESQLKWLIFHTADLCDCAMRRLMDDSTPPATRIDLNRRAATIYETLLDDAYGGFWDIPLLLNYAAMARVHLSLGEHKEADGIMGKFTAVLTRHTLPPAERGKAALVSSTHPYGYQPPEASASELLRGLLDDKAFEPYHATLTDLYDRLTAEGA